VHAFELFTVAVQKLKSESYWLKSVQFHNNFMLSTIHFHTVCCNTYVIKIGSIASTKLCNFSHE